MTAPNAAPSTWSVQGQAETIGVDPVTGKLVNGLTITLVTGLGNTGTVFVPTSVTGNLVTVKGIVGARAAQLDAVSTLTDAS
jgi:hypothetical protein